MWVVFGLMGVIILVAVVVAICELLEARKKSCSNKPTYHRFHNWSKWEVQEEVKTFYDDALTKRRGTKFNLRRDCQSCGLLEFKERYDYER